MQCRLRAPGVSDPEAIDFQVNRTETLLGILLPFATDAIDRAVSASLSGRVAASLPSGFSDLQPGAVRKANSAAAEAWNPRREIRRAFPQPNWRIEFAPLTERN
jgi:hypothetical protein